MRVVGGTARGRRLEAPPGQHTRPTTDRVRESIFNALWSRGVVDGARILDLFAGSGALGIEALSRGAAHATFVDDDARARRTIQRNLAACGFLDRAEVVADRAERFLHRRAVGAVRAGAAQSEGFELAFCDPPYAFDGWRDLLSDLPADLAVIEAREEVPVPQGWELVRSVRYGSTWVGFAQRG
jgi:16S rRNA (guanine966-N2)-methyltransferase